MAQSKERGAFSTSWGVVLTTAGVAIGLGNIWRFPYMVGRYGGGGFILVYLLTVAAFGVPALMCEWTLGRTTQRGPMGAFEKSAFPAGRFWGALLLLTIVMASSYYSVILGWVLYYGVLFSSGAAHQPSSEIFAQLTQSLPRQSISVLACIALSCGALALGVRSGIERVSKAVTPLFFVLFAFLAIRVLSLDGAGSRLVTYLADVGGNFTPRTVLAAIGQGMFSLSLGGTFMVIYGSYLKQDENIPRGAALTALLDVLAALLAAVIVITSVLVFSIPLDSGPKLMFVVMPEVFQNMQWGQLSGALFFFSILIVALLSLMGAYEVMIAAAGDSLGWSRRKALVTIAASQSILIIPAMISEEYLAKSDLIWGTTMQPLGAALAVAALLWTRNRSQALKAIASGSGRGLPSWLYYWIKYVVPMGILTGLAYGWLG